MNKKLIAALALIAVAAPLYAANYNIDPVHSGITFRVRHIVGRVTGRFEKVEGTFTQEDGNIKAWKAAAKIDAASINTNVQKRDEHLRSADFFDTAKCPSIEFKSTSVTDLKDNKAKLHGDLTMHCITKPVVLNLEWGGATKDPWGNMRAGAIATGKLNRKDFGIIWNKTLDNGGVMLGEDVEITLEIEGVAEKK